MSRISFHASEQAVGQEDGSVADLASSSSSSSSSSSAAAAAAAAGRRRLPVLCLNG